MKVHSIPKHATQTSKSMSVNNSCVRVNDKARLEHNCYCKPYLAIAKQVNDSQRKQSDRGHKTQYFIIQTSYNQRLHSNCQTKERNPNLKSLLL